MGVDLNGKVVLITGGASGIGAAIVRYLLEENVKHVAFLDIAQDAGKALEKELNTKYGARRCSFFNVDITNDAQLFGAFDSVKDKEGYIDIVINNAGLMNDQAYKKEIELNVTALSTSTLKALEMMRKDEGGKGGTIVNTSSIAALLQSPLMPIYFGTKAAVLHFTNCMATEDFYNRTGVRMITICYGATQTPLINETNIRHFDKDLDRRLQQLLVEHNPQRLESAARGMVDACKVGTNGSTWLSISNKPVIDITSTVQKAYKLLDDVVTQNS